MPTARSLGTMTKRRWIVLGGVVLAGSWRWDRPRAWPTDRGRRSGSVEPRSPSHSRPATPTPTGRSRPASPTDPPPTATPPRPPARRRLRRRRAAARERRPAPRLRRVPPPPQRRPLDGRRPERRAHDGRPGPGPRRRQARLRRHPRLRRRRARLAARPPAGRLLRGGPRSRRRHARRLRDGRRPVHRLDGDRWRPRRPRRPRPRRSRRPTRRRAALDDVRAQHSRATTCPS